MRQSKDVLHLLAILDATEDAAALEKSIFDSEKSAFDARLVEKDRDVKYYRDNADKAATNYERSLGEKVVRITQLGEEVSLLKEKINVVNAERDRFVRLVDQFLSVQIINHGVTVQPSGPSSLQSQPSFLRATGPQKAQA